MSTCDSRRRRPGSIGILGVALAVLAACLSGCSDNAEPRTTGGSLELSTSPGEWCLETLADFDEYTFGAEQVSNTGDETASVTRIDLVNASGLEIAGAYASPLQRGSLGVFSGWQGGERNLEPLKSVKPGETLWLSLRLRVLPDVGKRAAFDSISITYDEGDSSHEVHSMVGFASTTARC